MPRPISAKPLRRGPSAAKVAELRGFLDALMRRYHRRNFSGSDPLTMVHALPPGVDREVGALLAALLAYGNVKQIQRSLHTLFNAMDGRPGRFVARFDFPHAAAALAGFKHRFTTADDVLALCHLLHHALAGENSLEPFFLRGCRFDEESDLALAAGRFVENLSVRRISARTSTARPPSRAHPSNICCPAPTAAARPSGCICGCGGWCAHAPGRRRGSGPVALCARTSHLLVPVDTHLLRIGRHLGFTRLTTHSLAASRAK